MGLRVTAFEPVVMSQGTEELKIKFGGPHLFLVQLRSLDTHEVLARIKIGDNNQTGFLQDHLCLKTTHPRVLYHLAYLVSSVPKCDASREAEEIDERMVKVKADLSELVAVCIM
ncbi:hypothetical protein ACEPAG_9554 [Sanghuangporus baumii]